MHDATFVRSIERIGNLDSDLPRFVDRKRAVREPCLERRTLDHLHDDDLIRADAFESVNGRDVRVIERGEYLRFARKSRDAIRVIGKAVRQDFERNVTTELRVASPIHRSHSALADRRGDLVDADAGAWNEGHGRDYRVAPARSFDALDARQRSENKCLGFEPPTLGANHLRTQALAGVRICLGGRRLREAIEIEPKNVLTQNDLERPGQIGWELGTEFDTG